jgi:hypothetical protein
MGYPPGFPVRQVEEQAPNFRSQFFGGIQGSPAHPEEYRMPETSPYMSPYVGRAFRAPDFETGHFEMARTNLRQNLDDEVVEVSGRTTMTMESESTENSAERVMVINKSVKEVKNFEKFFGKK